MCIKVILRGIMKMIQMIRILQAIPTTSTTAGPVLCPVHGLKLTGYVVSLMLTIYFYSSIKYTSNYCMKCLWDIDSLARLFSPGSERFRFETKN